MYFASPIPLTWVLILTLPLALAVVLTWARSRSAMPRGSGRALLGLRLLLLVMLALLLANPYWVEHQPQRDAFRVGILVDLSGSMHVSDLRDGQSRVDFVREAVDPAADANLRARLGAHYALRISAFSHRLAASFDPGMEHLSGVTAIGTSLLEKAHNLRAQGATAGAIVLLTDGINLDGPSLAEAGIALRDMDLPVTVIGVGETRIPGDVELRFDDPPSQVELGEPVQMALTVANRFPRSQQVTLEFYEGNEAIGEQVVDIPAADEIEVDFTALPAVAGPAVFRARLKEAPAGDINPANDTAFALVDVMDKQVRDILYLASQPDYNYRFLQYALRGDAGFRLRSVLRLGPSRYVYSGFEEGDGAAAAEGFPDDASTYLGADVIVIDTTTLNALEEGMDEHFRRFLADRGGGVLVLGSPSEVSREWHFLFPVHAADTVVERTRNPLELIADPVFADLAGGVLFTPPPVYLPDDEVALLASEVALSGRPVMEVRRSGKTVMAVHAYGAGRSAWLGTRATWRWRMESHRGMEQHDLFWRHLLDWLGASGRPRVDMPLQGAVLSMDDALNLDIDVRGSDFRPVETGKVEAVIWNPDGTAQPPVRLTPSPYQPGRFISQAALDTAGEYRVGYTIELASGERLQREAFFVAAFSGRESRDLNFRENDLRDLARITGGRYYAYQDAHTIQTLPLAQNIPLIEHRHHWSHTPWFFALILLVAAFEWMTRRRFGLR